MQRTFAAVVPTPPAPWPRRVPRAPASFSTLLLILLLGTTPEALPQSAPAARADSRRDEAEAKRALAARHEMLEEGSEALTAYLMFVDLAAFDLPCIAKAAITELERGPVEHRPAARQLIAGFEAADTLAYVMDEGLGHKDAVVRAQVILALGEGQPPGIDWIPAVEAALDDRSDVVRAAAVEALGLAHARDSLDHVLRLQEDGSVRVRQRIPEALVRMIQDRSLPLLIVYGDDLSWRVRSAVVRALGALNSPQSIEALVDLLENESGRVQEDAWRQLERSTGRHLGPNADAWRRSLSLRPLGHQVPEPAPDAGSPAARPHEPTSIAPPVSGGSRVVHYGLPTSSRRIVVVNDCSNSMCMPEAPTIERPHDSANSEVHRLAMLKRQLTELIAGLDDEIAFNLVSFSATTKAWQPRLVSMDARRRSSALEEIHRYSCQGGTNIHAALDACFEMAEPSLDDADDEPSSPDTVFLLTDGLPTTGEIMETHLLLEYVAERNRDLHLRFQCIALTTESRPIAFMRDLAHATDGDFTCPPWR